LRAEELRVRGEADVDEALECARDRRDRGGGCGRWIHGGVEGGVLDAVTVYFT